MATMKLCLILNTAPHYRKGIYKKIDENFDCVWSAGQIESIKDLDWSDFKGEVIRLKNKKLISNFYWQSGVIKTVSRSDIDKFIVTGEVFNLSSWIAAIIAKVKGKELIFWGHGVYGKESTLKRLIYKLYWKLPAKGLIYNNRSRELLVKECGVNSDCLFTIHNSLDYENQLEIRKRLKPSPVFQEHFGNIDHNLIFIGRLTKVKRLDLLIDALKRLIDKGVKCNLTFVGDGTERHSLEEKVNELGLNNRVWFYGASYDDTTNAELIFNADLCVSPGNVGLTAMHSLVFGTPVLTHDDFPYQMPEFEAINDSATGSFFKKDDANSMADVIEGWLHSHKGDRDVVRQACYKEIDSSWTPNFQIKILKSVLK